MKKLLLALLLASAAQAQAPAPTTIHTGIAGLTTLRFGENILGITTTREGVVQTNIMNSTVMMVGLTSSASPTPMVATGESGNNYLFLLRFSPEYANRIQVLQVPSPHGEMDANAPASAPNATPSSAPNPAPAITTLHGRPGEPVVYRIEARRDGEMTVISYSFQNNAEGTLRLRESELRIVSERGEELVRAGGIRTAARGQHIDGSIRISGGERLQLQWGYEIGLTRYGISGEVRAR